MQVADRSKKKNKKKTKVVSFPTEIIEDIISRLPVKSILRSGSVSKLWLSLISNPSFNKLQFTRATESHRTGLFISAYDYSTKKRYYLTAANDGGPLTLLMTVDNDTDTDFTGPSQLNGGFMCFTSNTWPPTPPLLMNSQAFVVNPSTSKIFKLPDMNSASEHDLYSYLYGFDETRNEYKILLIKGVFKTKTFEFMIFSMSSFSWRKIDAVFPVGYNMRRLLPQNSGVCLNSVVYTMLKDMSYDILAFDFVVEKFSVISTPQAFFPDNDELGYKKYYSPIITKIDGCLGVVLHDWKMSEFRIWILQDYHNCLWVKETIKLSKAWNDLAVSSSPSIDVNMDGDIIFPMSKATKNAMIIPVYNRKSKRFKTVQFTFDDQFASSKSLKFHHIRSYVETIMPLVDNWSKTSLGESD